MCSRLVRLRRTSIFFYSHTQSISSQTLLEYSKLEIRTVKKFKCCSRARPTYARWYRKYRQKQPEDTCEKPGCYSIKTLRATTMTNKRYLKHNHQHFLNLNRIELISLTTLCATSWHGKKPTTKSNGPYTIEAKTKQIHSEIHRETAGTDRSDVCPSSTPDHNNT